MRDDSSDIHVNKTNLAINAVHIFLSFSLNLTFNVPIRQLSEMGWFGGGDSGDTSGGDTGFASKKKTYDYGDSGSTSTELDLRHVNVKQI